MYAFALGLHSMIRWLLLGTWLVALGRSLGAWREGRDWQPADEVLARVLMMAFAIQLILGFLLLVELSPVTAEAFRDMATAMKTKSLRFFVAEHPTGMFVAFVVAAIGRKRTRDADLGPRRHRDWSLALGISLLLALALIPWPGQVHGRPLLRGLA